LIADTATTVSLAVTKDGNSAGLATLYINGIATALTATLGASSGAIGSGTASIALAHSLIEWPYLWIRMRVVGLLGQGHCSYNSKIK